MGFLPKLLLPSSAATPHLQNAPRRAVPRRMEGLASSLPAPSWHFKALRRDFGREPVPAVQSPGQHGPSPGAPKHR